MPPKRSRSDLDLYLPAKKANTMGFEYAPMQAEYAPVPATRKRAASWNNVQSAKKTKAATSRKRPASIDNLLPAAKAARPTPSRKRAASSSAGSGSKLAKGQRASGGMDFAWGSAPGGQSGVIAAFQDMDID